MNFLKCQSVSRIAANGGKEKSLIFVPKMNESLTGLQRHEGK